MNIRFIAVTAVLAALLIAPAAVVGEPQEAEQSSMPHKQLNQPPQPEDKLQSSQEAREGQPPQAFPQSNYERARMRETEAVSRGVQEQVRSVLRDMLVAAVNENYQDLIYYFSGIDRERLGRYSGTNIFSGFSNEFKSQWKQQYNSSIEDSIKNTRIPMSIISGDRDNQTKVSLRLSGNTPSPQLTMERTGWLMTRYRVDAPNSLTKQGLMRNLESNFASLEAGFNWPLQRKDAVAEIADCVITSISGSITHRRPLPQMQ